MPESAQNLFRYVLTRSGRALNFQVHEQPEAWRCASPVGDVNVLKREMPSGVVVISENTPDLSGLVVCLRGRQVEGDGKVALMICDSEAEAMRVERDVHQALFEFATTGGFGDLNTPFSNHAHSAVVTFF